MHPSKQKLPQIEYREIKLQFHDIVIMLFGCVKVVPEPVFEF